MCLMMRTPLLLTPPVKRWECTRCDRTHVTREAQPHTPFHPCPGLAGLTAPLTPHGERVKVEARMREDYEGDELVTRDDQGRPVMAVQVTRDDGTDVAVFAPTAKVEM